VYLIGRPISNDELKYLKNDLKRYKLPYELKLNQDIVNNEKVDLMTLKEGVMKDLYQNNEAMLKIKNQQINDLQAKIDEMNEGRIDIAQLTKESLHWNPSILSLAINQTESFDAQTQKVDTIHIAFMTTSEPMEDEKRIEYEGWLKDRIPADSLIFKQIIK
jgi:N-methylhydantoinase B/oxoprolinase/acetone carboxylase alpha subunit